MSFRAMRSPANLAGSASGTCDPAAVFPWNQAGLVAVLHTNSDDLPVLPLLFLPPAGGRDTKYFIRVPSPSTASVKVKSASLGIRFLITRHSPAKILQTGLLGAPAEKLHGNQAGEEVSVRSLRSGFRSK
jgi:hypothetical protein